MEVVAAACAHTALFQFGASLALPAATRRHEPSAEQSLSLVRKLLGRIQACAHPKRVTRGDHPHSGAPGQDRKYGFRAMIGLRQAQREDGAREMFL